MGQIVSDVTEVLDYRKEKKEAESARKKILSQMAADDAAKDNLVKKVLATQRANYGASGMSASGTTAKAVLTRLRTETEQPYEDKRRANMEKLKQVKVKKPNLVSKVLSRFNELMG